MLLFRPKWLNSPTSLNLKLRATKSITLYCFCVPIYCLIKAYIFGCIFLRYNWFVLNIDREENMTCIIQFQHVYRSENTICLAVGVRSVNVIRKQTCTLGTWWTDPLATKSGYWLSILQKWMSHSGCGRLSDFNEIKFCVILHTVLYLEVLTGLFFCERLVLWYLSWPTVC